MSRVTCPRALRKPQRTLCRRPAKNLSGFLSQFVRSWVQVLHVCMLGRKTPRKTKVPGAISRIFTIKLSFWYSLSLPCTPTAPSRSGPFSPPPRTRSAEDGYAADTGHQSAALVSEGHRYLVLSRPPEGVAAGHEEG